MKGRWLEKMTWNGDKMCKKVYHTNLSLKQLCDFYWGFKIGLQLIDVFVQDGSFTMMTEWVHGLLVT